jgi:hypothetical protein
VFQLEVQDISDDEPNQETDSEWEESVEPA